MWVPNGLIVGCEALFVPFAGERAGYLFAVTAAGMLLGDIVVGRFLAVALRDRLIGPLRLLLAVPYLAFFLVPSLPYAAALAFVASVGYSASLPLQERLVTHTDGQARGQVFGLQGTGPHGGPGPRRAARRRGRERPGGGAGRGLAGDGGHGASRPCSSRSPSRPACAVRGRGPRCSSRPGLRRFAGGAATLKRAARRRTNRVAEVGGPAGGLRPGSAVEPCSCRPRRARGSRRP